MLWAEDRVGEGKDEVGSIPGNVLRLHACIS